MYVMGVVRSHLTFVRSNPSKLNDDFVTFNLNVSSSLL
jgi:hypothetical protein